MAHPEPSLSDLRIARFLLDQLADGIDPATKQPLPRDHAAQEPDSIRAIFRTSRLLHGLETESRSVPVEESCPRAEATSRERAGKPWTKLEDEELIDAFARHNTFRAIARAHHRSVGAITARLGRLGLIPDPRQAQGRPASKSPAPTSTPQASPGIMKQRG